MVGVSFDFSHILVVMGFETALETLVKIHNSFLCVP
jgi:hypothetical protein